MARTLRVYCDKCGAEITLEPSQNICLGKSKSYDLCSKCYISIAEKLADVENEITNEKEIKACYKCAYYSNRRFWSDNSVVATFGSCIKCKRNFVSSDPYNQIPSWCPLEEQKETEFHCGIEESGYHAYNCNDCSNKCEVYYQWNKETKK